jgi:hypothetical protein
MAQTGTVIPQGLNLRATPGGALILEVLSQNATVQVLEDQGEFLKVSIGGQVGFVKASLVKLSQATPQPAGNGHGGGNGSGNGSGNGDGNVVADVIPDIVQPVVQPLPQPVPQPAGPPAGAPGGSFHFEGNQAIAPDGTRFGRRSGPGIFNIGQTSIGQFVQSHGGLFAGLSPSRLHVMQAVSENEGRLEAINTFDNAFLTFGAFQWTVGVGNAAGELPSLVARLKRVDAAVFADLLGRFGLDVASVSSPPGQPPTGFLSLNGVAVKTAADKEHKLRTLEMAFRFFKSGQNDTMRRVEIEHAASRIDLFYRDAGHRVNGRFVADFVTSEFGVALILDEHVNRPGHVPGTLTGAVQQFIASTGRADPAVWTTPDERRLLDIYIQRRNGTNMTDSANRADRVRQAVAAGVISDARGSFHP